LPAMAHRAWFLLLCLSFLCLPIMCGAEELECSVILGHGAVAIVRVGPIRAQTAPKVIDLSVQFGDGTELEATLEAAPNSDGVSLVHLPSNFYRENEAAVYLLSYQAPLNDWYCRVKTNPIGLVVAVDDADFSLTPKNVTVEVPQSFQVDGSAVSPPTFEPNGGFSGTQFIVTIATKTADATVHYTTDGTVPTMESPICPNAVIIKLGGSKSFKLKAVAFVRSGPSNTYLSSHLSTSEDYTQVGWLSMPEARRMFKADPMDTYERVPGLKLRNNQMVSTVLCDPVEGQVVGILLRSLKHCRGKSLPFVDVGGNNGVFTAIAARLDCPTLVVEPQPSCADRIRTHIHLNAERPGLVRLVQGFVGEVTGPFRGAEDSGDCNGGWPIGRKGRQLDLQSYRLEDLVSEPVDFLKIDVEGHELQVFSGARSLFETNSSRRVSNVVVEVNPNWWTTVPLPGLIQGPVVWEPIDDGMEFFEWMCNEGYTMYLLQRVGYEYPAATTARMLPRDSPEVPGALYHLTPDDLPILVYGSLAIKEGFYLWLTLSPLEV